ncbi:MAG: TIM barrel protein [Alphaproteobacteria bacterium]|nr:TIM barrel protein [Alphaproteobacteria bacterium]
MLYQEYDFLDRFAAAAESGFRGVEYHFPYDFSANEISEHLQRLGLKQVLHNLPAGDWAGGERGIACLPDRQGEFQEGVGKAIEYANTLGCTQLNCLVGIQPVDNLGYEGWMGCEYVPATTTVDGLGWARSYLNES